MKERRLSRERNGLLLVVVKPRCKPLILRECGHSPLVVCWLVIAPLTNARQAASHLISSSLPLLFLLLLRVLLLRRRLLLFFSALGSSIAKNNQRRPILHSMTHLWEPESACFDESRRYSIQMERVLVSSRMLLRCAINPQIRTRRWRTRKHRRKTDHLLHTSQPFRVQSR